MRVSERLLKLSAHEAFFLLKNSLAIPRLQYILRSSPCCLSSELLSLDEEVRRILSSVLNLRLDSGTWTQASLPVRWGGIGVRSASALAPSAFLASATASATLIATLLLGCHAPPADECFEAACTHWASLAGVAFPPGQSEGPIPQRVLDDGICSALSNELLLQADPVNRARLLASLAPVRDPGCRPCLPTTWDSDWETMSCASRWVSG